MSGIYKSAEELVGNTPIVFLGRLKEKLGLYANVYAKLESANPAGSAKDRVALYMIDDAEKRGLIEKGSLIIEPTSGNTGIGIALIAAIRGYKAVIVMPDSMSLERIKLIEAYGAQVVLTDGALGMAGSIEKANQIKEENPGSFIAGQFTNPINPMAHYETTGPEIYRDTDGKVDYFVAGIGTGGTITGAGRYLKENIDGIKIVAVEPKKSPLLSGGSPSKHGIQGIGANFIPEILDREVYDRIITVNDEDAFESARLLAREEGLLAGISSGAALFAACTLAKDKENQGKNIVVILPDTGTRYLSCDLF